MREYNGHLVYYLAHRYRCARCSARLLSLMQFATTECPGNPEEGQ